MVYKNKKKKIEILTNPNYRIITHEEPLSIAAESYRRIKVSLDFASIDKELKVIQVCSSEQGEGKSITILNIASTYAENGKKTIVVDLDLRRPKLHRAFNLHNINGITDVLAGNIKLNDAIKTDNSLGFSLLNSGSKTAYPTALLGSKTLKELFKKLKEYYDIILVDCPPILAVSDAAIISELCDGCLFIVSQMKTNKNAAKDAIMILKKNNVNLLGVVFTEVNKNSKSYQDKYKYYQE